MNNDHLKQRKVGCISTPFQLSILDMLPKIPVLGLEPKNVVVTTLVDIPSSIECQFVEAFEIALKNKVQIPDG
jgi:hypothetical protein